MLPSRAARPRLDAGCRCCWSAVRCSSGTSAQRLLQDGRVEIRENSSVLDLAFSQDEARVVGVIVADRDGGVPGLVPGPAGRRRVGPQLAHDRVARAPRLLRSAGGRTPSRQAIRHPPASGSAADAVRATWPSQSRRAQECRAAGSCSRRRAASTSSRSSVGREFSRRWPGPSSSPSRARWPPPRWPTPCARMRPLDAGATYRFPANRRRRLGTAGQVPRRAHRHRRRVLRLRPRLRAGDDRGRHRGRGARPLPDRRRPGWPSGSTVRRPPSSTTRG